MVSKPSADRKLTSTFVKPPQQGTLSLFSHCFIMTYFLRYCWHNICTLGSYAFLLQDTFDRILDAEPFVSEYRSCPRHKKLTMELGAVVLFLSKTKADKKTKSLGPLASKALQQVKDQKLTGREMQRHITCQLDTVITTEKVAKGVDRKSCMDSLMPEGAVGELLQEIQRQTRLLEGEPRDIPHQMILVNNNKNNHISHFYSELRLRDITSKSKIKKARLPC